MRGSQQGPTNTEFAVDGVKRFAQVVAAVVVVVVVVVAAAAAAAALPTVRAAIAFLQGS